MTKQLFSVIRTGKSLISNLTTQIPRKNQSLLKYFQKKDGLIMENVEEFIDHRIPSINIHSPLEMVAALSLIAANEPFTNVIKALMGMSNEGMGEYFNDRFFVTLQHAVRDLMNLGLDKEAGDLLKIGEIAARIHNRAQWAEKFTGQIDAGLSSRIRDYPFLTQRGW